MRELYPLSPDMALTTLRTTRLRPDAQAIVSSFRIHDSIGNEAFSPGLSFDRIGSRRECGFSVLVMIDGPILHLMQAGELLLKGLV